jgi:hypothetical protein
MADGKQNDAEECFVEAMETHVQVLKLWTIVLGTKDSRTADANYKVGWHFHRMRDYTSALYVSFISLDRGSQHLLMTLQEVL